MPGIWKGLQADELNVIRSKEGEICCYFYQMKLSNMPLAAWFVTNGHKHENTISPVMLGLQKMLKMAKYSWLSWMAQFMIELLRYAEYGKDI